MLMLEARDICGGATGRNGEIPFFTKHTVEWYQEDQWNAANHLQVASFDPMHTRDTQHGRAALGLMVPWHSSSMRWPTSRPLKSFWPRKGFLRK